MNDLQQFVGATVETIQSHPDGVSIQLKLPNGEQRYVAVYTVAMGRVAVRIDGMFVPPEEL